jgi:hypothetical protein
VVPFDILWCLSVAPQIFVSPAYCLAGGMSAIIFLGDLFGFRDNATGSFDHFLPYLGIGRGLLYNVAGELAQQY